MGLITYSRPAKAIARIAVALWCISLALPTFISVGGLSRMVGLEVLIAGIAMGWGVGGWAAYANVLFVVAAYGIFRDGRSVRMLCVAMMILAATTPLFDGPILSEATMESTPVASWGWGAVVWWISICLLSAAAWLQESKPSKAYTSSIAIGALAVIALTLFVRIGQWQRANDQEKELYLPASMAFTTVDFCELPFNWPNGALISQSDQVSIEIDTVLNVDYALGKSVYIPKISEPIVRGHRWINHQKVSPFMPEIKIGQEASSEGTFVLKVNETKDGATIRFINPSGIQVFEQPLRRRASKTRLDQYCPYSGVPNSEVPYRGYYDALITALQPRLEIPQTIENTQTVRSQGRRLSLQMEAAGSCASSEEVGGGRKGIQTLDGRPVMLGNDARSFASFCSENYLALVFVRSSSAESGADLNSDVFVYDRKSLRPMAEFGDRSGCVASNTCVKGILPRRIDGLVISDEWVRVRTDLGESTAKRKS